MAAMFFLIQIAIFGVFPLMVTEGFTDGRTDGRPDGRTVGKADEQALL